MAFIYGEKVAVGLEELVPHFFSSYNTLKMSLYRFKDKPYGLKRITLGGNGRILQVDYDTLPQDIKMEIADPRKDDHCLEKFYKVDGDAVRFFSTIFKFDDGTYLKQEQQEKYIINSSVLHAIIKLRDARLLDWKRKGRKSMTGMMQMLVSDATSFNKTLRSKHNVEHTLPASKRHFQDSLSKFEEIVDGKLNFASLVSKKFKNDNSRKVFDNTEKLLNDMFADKQAKPTATDVYNDYDSFIDGYIDVINNETGELYDPKGFKKLSFATINNYLQKWENRIGTHQKRTDDRQLKMGKYKPSFGFKMPEFAGSIISIDDRQPPFKTLENGKRIWVYMGVDVASRAIIAVVTGESKEGIIMDFYRQLIRNYHELGLSLPGELECEMSLNSSYRDTFLREGAMFKYVKMEANNARGKYIERVNEEFRYRLEKKREGWIARPKAIKESNQMGIETEKIKKLPYKQIVENVMQDIETWNNEAHPTAEGISKWQYLLTRQHEDLVPTEYLSFLKHVGYRTPTSCNVGNVHLNNSLFLIAQDGQVAKGEKLIQYMSRIEGNDIAVYWLDDNAGQVIKAYAYMNDEYICELVEKPRPNRARMERSDKDKIAESLLAAYTNTVDSFGKRKISELDKVTIIDNRPKPARHFRFAELDKYHQVATAYDQPKEEEIESEEVEISYTSSRKPLKDRI